MLLIKPACSGGGCYDGEVPERWHLRIDVKRGECGGNEINKMDKRSC